jgi:hypothetical protein
MGSQHVSQFEVWENCRELGINPRFSDTSIDTLSHRSQPRGNCLSLGTSSVTAHYWLKDAGVSWISLEKPLGEKRWCLVFWSAEIADINKVK